MTLNDLHVAGFDLSVTGSGSIHVRCSQCRASVVNGVACHETGCPNAARAKREAWLEQGDDSDLFSEIE